MQHLINNSDFYFLLAKINMNISKWHKIIQKEVFYIQMIWMRQEGLSRLDSSILVLMQQMINLLAMMRDFKKLNEWTLTRLKLILFRNNFNQVLIKNITEMVIIMNLWVRKKVEFCRQIVRMSLTFSLTYEWNKLIRFFQNTKCRISKIRL